MTLFWGMFLLVTIGLMLDESEAELLRTRQYPWMIQILISPLMLFVQWVLLTRFRAFWMDLMRKIPLPSLVKYLTIGFFLSNIVGNNFAIQFALNQNDFHPNPFLNTVLYIGPYLAILLTLYIYGYFFTLNYAKVFWLIGIAGSLIEQNFLILIGLVINPITIFLLFVTIPAYGVPLASIWVVMPTEELPQGRKGLPIWGAILCLILCITAYYLGAFLWWSLFDQFFHTTLLTSKR